MPVLSRSVPRVAMAGALAVLVVIVAGCESVVLTPSQDKALTALNHDRTANARWTLPDRSDVQHKAQAWAERLARENALYHSKPRVAYRPGGARSARTWAT